MRILDCVSYIHSSVSMVYFSASKNLWRQDDYDINKKDFCAYIKRK